MGTTQRMTPGVSGEPNWGDLNKSITSIAKTVETEQKLEEDEQLSSQEVAKKYAKLSKRRTEHVKSVYKKLLKTGGGSKKIASGRSKSIGRAGMRSTRKLSGFFSGVGKDGLDQTLNKIGFGSLQGKSFQEVLDYLLVFCSESQVGMDETAANSASCEILKDLAELADNKLEIFEQLIKEYVDGNGLSDILCKFWGLYIFEHLSQRFEEKISQQKGSEVSIETFKIIKEDILGQVKVLNTQRPVIKIDWEGEQGKLEIEKIFSSVLEIISDGNN